MSKAVTVQKRSPYAEREVRTSFAALVDGLEKSVREAEQDPDKYRARHGKVLHVKPERARIRLLRDIANIPGVPYENLQAVMSFYNNLKSRAVETRTTVLYFYAINKFLPLLGPKTLEATTREDIQTAFAKLDSIDLAARTVRDIKINIKLLYKHALGNGEFYPPCVAWFHSAKPKKKKLPEDMLSEEDVLKMIKVCKNFRDQAQIALLWDTGIRIGELTSIRLKDLDLGGTPGHVKVNGKVGERRVPISFAVPYLVQYIESRKDLEPEDTIWRELKSGHGVYFDDEESHYTIRFMLRAAAMKAGIKKRIFPHKFRASRATDMAGRMTEQSLKSFMGWTQDSAQASVYVAQNNKQIDNAYLNAMGLKIEDDSSEAKLKGSKPCPRCRIQNPISNTRCGKCGSHLDPAMAVKEEQAKEVVKTDIVTAFASASPDEKAKLREYIKGIMAEMATDKGAKKG
ncbi:MAG: tyrosine-type recombinase/integrase [Candidatus Micrarchaeota archaeon]|nr:tyrosine-type recombinase/integrase [Candidatus Micrarchaeota archaeon]MDE1859245.1 tyrosine-type recombinase/integrase [Candidatus Micrarchaeota archaeon]